jgi:hypothetical protein
MLDLAKLIPQLQAMTEERGRQIVRFDTAHQLAEERLRTANPEWKEIQAKIAQSKTSWLVADLLEPPFETHPLPPRPLEYTALATDGSQIAPDRHESIFCYVLNVGTVAIRYGESSYARLSSHPELAFSDELLFEDIPGDRAPITGKRLAMRRLEAECSSLGTLIEELPADGSPALAMCDGTLILWMLETEQPEYRGRIIAKFEQMLDTARGRQIPIIGYISKPGSRDVINSLRIHSCPKPAARCETYCSEHLGSLRRTAPCGGIEELTDDLLFSRLLKPGQRSALFGSRSKILKEYKPDNSTCFFYLNTGEEIARIELPRWVAHDAGMLSLAHALAFDQAEKGQGYPRALTEAHEQAVVRGADRSAFFNVMERIMAREHLKVHTTRKALAKRTRSI